NDLGRMAGTPHHQGVIARVSSYPYTALKDLLALKTIVMLDSIEDPQNLGAIVRSAYALAEAGIVIPENRSASITPAVVKASAGATERAYIARVKNLRVAAQELKKNGFWIVGLDTQAKECIRDIPRFAQTLLVLGGEDTGIRPLVAREIDVMARIPMKGPFNSLNVAQSAAIALYELMSG
ncbi:MAG: 23S rRNA (guanosine(2251)-2'-O)-methyltransferase RlmB, partial [Desulfomonilia bacterium]